MSRFDGQEEKMKDGGPVYPIPESKKFNPKLEAYYYVPSSSGLSLLDYFAAAALTGLLASGRSDGNRDLEAIAFDRAESMLAERERRLEGK